LDIDPVSGHGVKALNGKVLVEDPHGQNGKPRGPNGKDHDGDAKDASEGTESEDSRHICEDDQLVADERNGLGHGTEEEDQDLETEDDEVEIADALIGDESVMEDIDGEDEALCVVTESQYVSMCIAQSVERKAIEERLQQFKSGIVSKLETLRADTLQKSVTLRDLQSRYNHAIQDKRRLQQAKDKLLKETAAKEKSVKAMQTKLNQLNQSAMRAESQIQKVRKDAASKREQLNRINDQLKEQNEKLLKKVEETKMEVEAERKAKLSVKQDNVEYLRNERLKMGRDLQKELVHARSLEDQVNELTAQIQTIQSESNRFQSKCFSAEKRIKSEELKAQKACKERDDAVQSLQRKSRLFKEQQITLRKTQEDMDRLVERSLTQKTDIRQLQEAVRKKSQFETEYDDHKKRLNARDKKLREREKAFEEKSKKASGSRRQPNANMSSPSKSNKRGTRDQNKGNTLRDLPFHWLSLFPLIILMISIAQKR